MRIILDSCLLLSFLRKESNWQEVKNYLLRAKKGKEKIFLCWINLIEVYYKIYRKRGEIIANKTLSIIKKLPIKLVIPDEDLFIKAGWVKGNFAISLADCFIVALAKQLKATVLTGDPEFKKIVKVVKIIWLRK